MTAPRRRPSAPAGGSWVPLRIGKRWRRLPRHTDSAELFGRQTRANGRARRATAHAARRIGGALPHARGRAHSRARVAGARSRERPRRDAPHLTREDREHCGLKPVAGSDLKSSLVPAESERREHPCDQRWLCRHLPMRDRKQHVPYARSLDSAGTNPWRGIARTASSTRSSLIPSAVRINARSSLDATPPLYLGSEG